MLSQVQFSRRSAKYLAIVVLSLLMAGLYQVSPAGAAPAVGPTPTRGVTTDLTPARGVTRDLTPARGVTTSHPHFFKTHVIGRSAHNTRTSNTDLLNYNGGRVMQSTSTSYAIFWEPPTLQDTSATGVSTTYNSLIQRYFGDIGGTGLYRNNAQYYDSAGHIVNSSTLGGTWIDTSAYPNSGCTDQVTPQDCLTDVQIQAEVTRAMAANGWTSGLTHLFYVFTSAGEGSCFDANSTACAFTQYCAYHSYFNNSKQQPVIYANMPYTGTSLSGCGVPTSPNNDFDADSTISVISHEHMESVTDPQLNAWYDSQGNEIGDKCAWNFGNTSLDGGSANVQWNSHFYIVQQEWSNASDGCTLSGQMAVVYTGSNDGNINAVDASSGALLWQYKTGAAVVSSPTVANGTVYVGSKDHFVYALNASNGALLWHTQTGDAVYSSPIVVNGTLFVGSNDGSLYALKGADGTVLWHYKTGSAVSSSPAVAGGVVYASSNNGFLYALNASKGTLLWHYQVRKAVFSSPAVANKVVYAGTSNGFLYALDASKGRVLWSYKTGSATGLTPTVTRNIVYIGCSNGQIYALSANKGTLLWHYKTKGSIGTQVTVANGVAYFGSYDDNLYALKTDRGTLIWHYLAASRILSSPAVVSGEIYFGSDDHNLYALSASSSLLSWRYLAGAEVQSSPTLGP